MLPARDIVRIVMAAMQRHAAASFRPCLLGVLMYPLLTWATMPVDGLILVQRPDQTLHGRLNFQDKAQARDVIVRLASAREYKRFGLALPDFASDAMVQEDMKLPGVLFISTAQAVRSREFDLVFKTALSTGVAYTRFHAKVASDNSITLVRTVLAVDKVSDTTDSAANSEGAQRQDPKIKETVPTDKRESPEPKPTVKSEPADPKPAALKDDGLKSSEKKGSTKRESTESRKTGSAQRKPNKSADQQETVDKPGDQPTPAQVPGPIPASVSAPGSTVTPPPVLPLTQPAQPNVPTVATPYVTTPVTALQAKPQEASSLSDSVSLQINKLDLILWFAGFSMMLSVGAIFWTAFSRKNDEIRRLKNRQPSDLETGLPLTHAHEQSTTPPPPRNQWDTKKPGSKHEGDTESLMVQAIAQKYSALATAQIRANY
jgi:hypothetical protein